MSPKNTDKTEARLTLKSQLANLTLVLPWLDALAREHAIPADTHFAISLCLEEALSNIIRHGYRGEVDQSITIDFASLGPRLIFTVEDSAPPFAQAEPRNSEPQATGASLEDFEAGGQGLRLMRRFAGSLAWERLPRGNRLTICFTVAPPASGPGME